MRMESDIELINELFPLLIKVCNTFIIKINAIRN